MLNRTRAALLVPVILLAVGCAGGEKQEAASADNPCAAEMADNPCAANPCAAEMADNPCAENPCAENPCATNPCNPCADKKSDT